MCWSKSLRAAPVACIGPICGEGAAGAGATRVVRAGIPAISKILVPGLAASARAIAASERVLVLLSEGVQGLFSVLGALEKGVPGMLLSRSSSASLVAASERVLVLLSSWPGARLLGSG